MLASSARSLASASLRRVAARSVATATKAAAAPTAVALDHQENPLPTLSEGDLAWFEVYGVDSDEMLRDAQAEQPIALNAPTNTGATTAASQQDIWSVVFGTTH